MKKQVTAKLLMLAMIFWSFSVFINSIGKEPWRITFASVAFIGFVAISILFFRKIRQQGKSRQTQNENL
jgi:hypothetical protein